MHSGINHVVAASIDMPILHDVVGNEFRQLNFGVGVERYNLILASVISCAEPPFAGTAFRTSLSILPVRP